MGDRGAGPRCALVACSARARLRVCEPSAPVAGGGRAGRRRSQGLDRRVRIARLTPAGLYERAVLDRRSDALAASLLAPLRRAQRERLVAAMGDVERLLSAAMVEVDAGRPRRPTRAALPERVLRRARPPIRAGVRPRAEHPRGDDALRPPAGLLLLATLGDDPIGCGALKFHGHEAAELKRMWVADLPVGSGMGRRLLGELESARLNGGATARTARDEPGAHRGDRPVSLRGLREVAPFNDEPYAHHWFEKPLSRR